MKAILWPQRFADMQMSWAAQFRWLTKALQACGVEVKRHAEFKCSGLETLPLYNRFTDGAPDIAIYNHISAADLTGHVLQAKVNWFVKPTVPDEVQTTLDTLGYGPYSSITFKKPDYESVPIEAVRAFFAGRVQNWMRSKVTKWGGKFQANADRPALQDYNLVLGQYGGDSVVTKMDFGSYVSRLEAVVRELVRVSEHPVVVKLHPYMDGTDAKDSRFSDAFKARLAAISPRVAVFSGKSSVHNFLPGARCVLLANSGAGFEAMMHRKPIIAWGCPEYRWVAYDLRLLAELGDALRLGWFDPARQDRFLCWYMETYCFKDQPSATRRVAELLATLTPKGAS